MLRVDRGSKKLVRLADSTLSDAEHWERDLQDMICRDPEPFLEEIDEPLWIIGQEIRPSDSVPDRIDILAVDEDGAGVVLELKRGTNKLQLLQAISYAGMIAHWPQERFVEALATAYHQTAEDAQSAIEEHIGSELAIVNRAQRIILIAEDFDPALLIAAEWLTENYGVSIRCYRIALSQEAGNDYLTCERKYPPLEISSLTRRPGGKPEATTDSLTTWDAALAAVDNPALVSFFRSELNRSIEHRLRQRELIYRVGDKRRFYASCRRKYAYVWQEGRFDGDEEFWRKLLSNPGSVTRVKGGQALRFQLITQADFEAFGNAMSKDLREAQFSEPEDFAGPKPEA